MRVITTTGINPMVNPFIPKEMVIRTEKNWRLCNVIYCR